MTTQVSANAKAAAWTALETHYQQARALQLRDLFAQDPGRAEHFTVEAAGIFLDYSKNRVTEQTCKLLVELAEACGLRARIDAMFRGDKINRSENRAVLHVALRAPSGTSIVVDGENVVPAVHAVLDKMEGFANSVRSGAWKGHTGKPIANVVNIGIGGSDLGPVMAYEALRYYSRRDLTFRFVSNVDATDFAEAVRDLDPAQTLFIVASKTFTTLETMTNAHLARQWSARRLGRRRNSGRQAFRRRLDECRKGRAVRHRHREHVRVLGLGRRPLLDGLGHWPVHDAGDRTARISARCWPDFMQMDEHFRTPPFERNLPVLLGLLRSGTTISSALKRWPCCRTNNI